MIIEILEELEICYDPDQFHRLVRQFQFLWKFVFSHSNNNQKNHLCEQFWQQWTGCLEQSQNHHLQAKKANQPFKRLNPKFHNWLKLMLMLYITQTCYDNKIKVYLQDQWFFEKILWQCNYQCFDDFQSCESIRISS